MKKKVFFFSVLSVSLLLFYGCKKEAAINLAKLKGKWQLTGTSEQIVIDDTMIHYLYLNAGYPYEIKYDTLLYVHFDLPGDSVIRITEFGIRKLNEEILEIDNGSTETSIYKRIP